MCVGRLLWDRVGTHMILASFSTMHVEHEEKENIMHISCLGVSCRSSGILRVFRDNSQLHSRTQCLLQVQKMVLDTLSSHNYPDGGSLHRQNTFVVFQLKTGTLNSATMAARVTLSTEYLFPARDTLRR